MSWLVGVKAYVRDESGASAAEFALWIVFMTWPLLNVVDLGFYIFQTMQVRQAAQVAAQAAQTICGETGATPAASTCLTANSTLWTKLNDAAQSTSLGTNVSIGASSSTNGYEGYYCTKANGTLVAAESPATWAINGGTPTASYPPASCSSIVTSDNDPAADFVAITASYTYTPLFGGITLLGLFQGTSNISQTAWMRLN